MPEICSEVIECINNDVGTREALNTYVNSLGLARDNISYADTPQAGIYALEGLPACDPNHMFAATRQTVKFINRVCQDFYEKIEGATTFFEQVSEAIDSIPVISDAWSFTEVFLSNVATAYITAYDTTIEDELSCGLFCLALENCELTYQQICEYFFGLLVADLTDVTLEEFMAYWLNGTFVGNASVYASFAFVFGLLSYGASFAGIDYLRIVRALSSFYNDTDGDWEYLCDDCDTTWCVELDFSNPDGTVIWQCGTVSGGDLLNSVTICQTNYNAGFYWNMSAFKLIRWEIDMQLTGNNPAFRRQIQTFNGGTQLNSQDVNPSAGS